MYSLPRGKQRLCNLAIKGLHPMPCLALCEAVHPTSLDCSWQSISHQGMACIGQCQPVSHASGRLFWATFDLRSPGQLCCTLPNLATCAEHQQCPICPSLHKGRHKYRQDVLLLSAGPPLGSQPVTCLRPFSCCGQPRPLAAEPGGPA